MLVTLGMIATRRLARSAAANRRVEPLVAGQDCVDRWRTVSRNGSIYLRQGRLCPGRYGLIDRGVQAVAAGAHWGPSSPAAVISTAPDGSSASAMVAARCEIIAGPKSRATTSG